MGLFGAIRRWRAKSPPTQNLLHISYNDDTLLEDQKTKNI